jgi:chorismate mutase
MVLGKLNIYMWKIKHILTLLRINSKWIKGLKVRPETLKLLEENAEQTQDIGASKKFLNRNAMTRKQKQELIKSKIDVMAHARNPSYWRSIGRRIMSLRPWIKVSETLFQQKMQTKGLGAWLKW